MNRLLLLVFLVGSHRVFCESNAIIGSSARRITSGDELVSSVIEDCFDGEESIAKCIRLNALNYMDYVAGPSEEKRSFAEDADDIEQLDDVILNRVQRFLRNNEFKIQLPEFLFQEATLTFRPSRGLDFDVTFPPAPETEAREFLEGMNITRDMTQQKLLLPLLLLLKIKLKALTPIMVALVGMKALKALILSKIAILLVLGFLAVQLFKKVGMGMPMMPSMMVEPVTPMPYGAPPSSSYGAPMPPPVTMSSYEPSWEPSGGPYSRNWDAQQMAYSGYAGNKPASVPQNGQVNL